MRSTIRSHDQAVRNPLGGRSWDLSLVSIGDCHSSLGRTWILPWHHRSASTRYDLRNLLNYTICPTNLRSNANGTHHTSIGTKFKFFQKENLSFIVEVGNMLPGETLTQKEARNDYSSHKKNIVLSKIEYVCLDLVRQLALTPPRSRLILRANADDAHKQIVIRPCQGKRLAYIMQCLSQIYHLIRNDQQSTKRDLYYEHKKLYETQSSLDRAVTSICDLLDEPRMALNIVSSSKGLLFGALAFMTDEEKLIDCRSQPILISESLENFRFISDAQFIIVVEKDAIFQKLIDEGYLDHFPKSLLVTGKGYPDICTRKVLQCIVDHLAIPIYGLFDSDPHGIEIMLTYKYGSSLDSVEGRCCRVRQMQWLGFKPSDISSLPVVNHHFLKLNNRDFMKIRKIRRRAQTLGEHDVVDELSIFERISGKTLSLTPFYFDIFQLDKMYLLRSKLELEAISATGPQFIIRDYIMPRLTVLLRTKSPSNRKSGEQAGTV
ncbi:Spo-11p [Parelaphostrongylus tenuis]|uniref:DNA topoisomerase (ATP-hydrolyzing) n=1 Tax=Parelaphostrongylus tenuis TaxID=148309 RepID=A0AAD5MNY8_PARTN|nr:Spo-11p [Parelaphostrongylus tenuis]